MRFPSPALAAVTAVTAVTVLASFGLATSCATPQLGDRALPPAPSSLRAAFEAMPAPSTGKMQLIPDNAQSWLLRFQALEQAQTTIDAQYFIVEPDVYGLTLLALMAEKARAGVRVRFLVDARGSFDLIRGGDRWLLQEVERAGVQAKVYNPILFNLANMVGRGDLRAVSASNHDKLLLVDGAIAIAGGRNLSRDYMADAHDHPKAFIDLDAFLTGPAITGRLTDAFTAEYDANRSTALIVEPGVDGTAALQMVARAARLWLHDDPQLLPGGTLDAQAFRLEQLASWGTPNISVDAQAIARRVAIELVALPHLRGALNTAPPLALTSDDVELRTLDTWSSEGTAPKNTVNEHLLAALQSATKEVVLQSPYFILTPRGLRAFEEASARGVQITVLTNSPMSSDSAITQAAFLEQWPELLAVAPTARLFVTSTPRLMHAKAGVIDRELTFVGSYNLDPLSAGVNGEVVTAVWSAQQGAHLASLIETLIATGAPDVVEYRIERDAKGVPVRDEAGKLVVVHGPDDHCDPSVLAKVRRLRPVLKMLAPLL